MQFLSPWFLLGALAVGVPIWLHLIRHEQAVRIPFSSLMFFRRIPIKSVSRQRLKYLLLLSLRTLIILLIVLAFARPYFPGMDRLLGSGAEGKHVVILLDTSLSMQYADRWPRAVEAAREAIARMGPRDQAQLIAFSSDFQIQNLPTSDKAALRAILEGGLRPNASTTSYAQAFRAVERIAEDASQPLAAVLISDLQKSGVGQPPQNVVIPAVEEFRVVDVAQPDAPNWTIEGVRSRRVVYRARYPERLPVVVRGFGTPETTKEVVLSLGEKILERKTVVVPASGTVPVVFESFDVPNGGNRGSVRIIPGDRLAADDTFHFTVERREPYRILLLREAGEETELYYFRNALAAEPESPYRVEARAPAEAASLSLPEYRMVILSNVGTLPTSLAANLRDFVRAGGGMLITAGHRFPAPTLERQFREMWPAKATEKRLLTRDAERLVLLGEFDREHPLFREFQESGAESLRSTEVYGYIRLQPEGAVLLRFANGDPALVERPFGQGRVLLFASSFDNVWSDFPLHPAFIPLMHQLVRHATQLPEEPPAFTIPTTVSLRGYKAGTGDESKSRVWDIIGPDGKREVPLAEETRPDFLVLRQPGFYEVRQQQARHLIAANPDPRESDLARLSEEDRALWTRGVQSRQEAAPAAASMEQARRQTLWWNLLLIAFLLGLAEVYLANQYLGPRRAAVLAERGQEDSYVR